jgi:hypothetical protein
MWMRSRGARALAGGASVVLVSALAVSLAFAGYEQGRYGGDSLRQANEPVSFKVKNAKSKKGKKKTKVKSFKITHVVAVCTVTPSQGEEETGIVTLRDSILFGGAKVKRKSGSFELKKKYFPDLDNQIVAKASGKLSKEGSAEGEFTVRISGHGVVEFDDGHSTGGLVECRQTFPETPGAEEWEASLIG